MKAKVSQLLPQTYIQYKTQDTEPTCGEPIMVYELLPITFEMVHKYVYPNPSHYSPVYLTGQKNIFTQTSAYNKGCI